MRFTALVVDDNAALAQNLGEILESIPEFELNSVVASTRRQAFPRAAASWTAVVVFLLPPL